MAKRRARKTKRRAKKGFSIIEGAQTYMLASAVTNTMFNVNLKDFFLADHVETGVAAGSYGTGAQITMKELLSTTQVTGITQNRLGQTYTSTGDTMSIIQQNLKNNWVQGATSMIVIPLGFKIGKRLGRQAINKSNKLLRDLGVYSTVAV